MALVFDNKTYIADQRLGERGVYGTFLFQLPVNDYSYVVLPLQFQTLVPFY